MTEPSDVYEIALAPPARRAITSKLPSDVAAAAVDLITAPLIGNPKRLGKPLHAPLDGTWSARLMRDWRVLYEIDEESLGARIDELHEIAELFSAGSRHVPPFGKALRRASSSCFFVVRWPRSVPPA